jgi:hypothetical protein
MNLEALILEQIEETFIGSFPEVHHVDLDHREFSAAFYVHRQCSTPFSAPSLAWCTYHTMITHLHERYKFDILLLTVLCSTRNDYEYKIRGQTTSDQASALYVTIFANP